MARLSDKEIAKLSPEERRKRQKRLEYNRKYDAAKKKGKKVAKTTRKSPTRNSVAAKQREVNSQSEKVELMKNIANELDALYTRESELLQQLRDMLA